VRARSFAGKHRLADRADVAMNVVIIVAGAILIIDSRLRSALAAYVVFAVGALWFSFPRGSEVTIGSLAMFGALALIKIVAAPSALLWLRWRHQVTDDLGPSFSLALRVVMVLMIVALARYISDAQAFNGVSEGTIVFYEIFASISTILVHRNLIAHVIGLLGLGSAVTLAAAVYARALPGAIDAADTFDAIVTTLIAIAIARAVAVHDPRLDIRSLRKLRG
jgi:hypothetical protein